MDLLRWGEVRVGQDDDVRFCRRGHHEGFSYNDTARALCIPGFLRSFLNCSVLGGWVSGHPLSFVAWPLLLLLGKAEHFHRHPMLRHTSGLRRMLAAHCFKGTCAPFNRKHQVETMFETQLACHCEPQKVRHGACVLLHLVASVHFPSALPASNSVSSSSLLCFGFAGSTIYLISSLSASSQFSLCTMLWMVDG